MARALFAAFIAALIAASLVVGGLRVPPATAASQRIACGTDGLNSEGTPLHSEE